VLAQNDTNASYYTRKQLECPIQTTSAFFAEARFPRLGPRLPVLDNDRSRGVRLYETASEAASPQYAYRRRLHRDDIAYSSVAHTRESFLLGKL
jgi:hypothetical protein